jgi:F-type H+-transporting ATPase subunit a
VTIYDPLHHATGVSVAIQASVLVGLLILLAGFVLKRQIARADGGIVPDEGFSFRNILEVMVEALAGICEERLGNEWRKYFPVVATIFFFILAGNLLGLLPGVGGPTANANTTWAWAVIAWLVYTAVGIMKHKHNYLVKFMGPSFFEREMFGRKVHFRLLMPIFLILEIPLDLARIGTLAVRLLANMYADHLVIAIWLTLVPVGIPAIFMGLGLVISVLQAFIFALLTMIYIGLALDEPH